MKKRFFFLLKRKEIYTLKLIIALNFSLLCHDICFQSFFPSFLEGDLHLMNVSCANETIHWKMGFFNLHLRQTKHSVYVTTLFCLLTIRSHKNVFNKIAIQSCDQIPYILSDREFIF